MTKYALKEHFHKEFNTLVIWLMITIIVVIGMAVAVSINIGKIINLEQSLQDEKQGFWKCESEIGEPISVDLWMNYTNQTMPLIIKNESGWFIEEDCVDEDYWYNYGGGITFDTVDWNRLDKTLDCLRKEIECGKQKYSKNEQRLSNISIINNSKGEYSVSVWSRNGTLLPSENVAFQKLNALISYSNSEEWKYYVYTFEEKYYIDGVEISNVTTKQKCSEDEK